MYVILYLLQVSMIEKAMRDVHFSAHPTRSAKQQVSRHVLPVTGCSEMHTDHVEEEDLIGPSWVYPILLFLLLGFGW